MTDPVELSKRLREDLEEIQTPAMAGDTLRSILFEPFECMSDADTCRDAVLNAIHAHYADTIDSLTAKLAEAKMALEQIDESAFVTDGWVKHLARSTLNSIRGKQ